MEVFEQLSGVNLSGKTDKKNGLSYLSWAFAWGEIKSKYTDASYTIKRFKDIDGLEKPYMYDELLGYMVETEMTICGITHGMWLPVMDGANKSMKALPYKYSTKYGEKTVEAATMFDINKTLMRCLVKNMAMFGLGLYIYAGEDLPESETKNEISTHDNTNKASIEPETEAVFTKIIMNAKSDSELEEVFKRWRHFKVSKEPAYNRLLKLTKEKKDELSK